MTDRLNDGDDLGNGAVLSTRGGHRVGVYRCKCGREQTAAVPGFSGGIGTKTAAQIGWEQQADGSWLCPFCTGNEDKLMRIWETS